MCTICFSMGAAEQGSFTLNLHHKIIKTTSSTSIIQQLSEVVWWRFVQTTLLPLQPNLIRISPHLNFCICCFQWRNILASNWRIVQCCRRCLQKQIMSTTSSPSGWFVELLTFKGISLWYVDVHHHPCRRRYTQCLQPHQKPHIKHHDDTHEGCLWLYCMQRSVRYFVVWSILKSTSWMEKW